MWVVGGEGWCIDWINEKDLIRKAAAGRGAGGIDMYSIQMRELNQMVQKERGWQDNGDSNGRSVLLQLISIAKGEVAVGYGEESRAQVRRNYLL